MIDIRIQPRAETDPDVIAYLRLIGGRKPKSLLWWQTRPNMPPAASRTHSMGIWTGEEIEDVLDLIAMGYTRKQIAQAYGVTRNSICGVIHRARERRKGVKK